MLCSAMCIKLIVRVSLSANETCPHLLEDLFVILEVGTLLDPLCQYPSLLIYGVCESR